MAKLLVIAALIITSCQVARPTVPDRTILVAKMAELRSYEIDRAQLAGRLAALREYGLLPMLSKEKRSAVQDAADIAYVYYFSCITALGNDRIQDAAIYLSHAQAELDRANAILLEAMRELEF